MAQRTGWAAAALATVWLLSGCHGSSEPTTAPVFERGGLIDPSLGGGTCVRECAAAQNAALMAELDRYRRSLDACNFDRSCLLEQATLHEAILQEITLDFQGCKTVCP
jgi:hypothetical protein